MILAALEIAAVRSSENARRHDGMGRQQGIGGRLQRGERERGGLAELSTVAMAQERSSGRPVAQNLRDPELAEGRHRGHALRTVESPECCGGIPSEQKRALESRDARPPRVRRAPQLPDGGPRGRPTR